jgi:hypothetical protein
MRDLPALALDELQSESVQLLPRRETLCQFACVNVANVVGVNLAIAVNAATIGADASAVAQQYLGAMQQ